MYSTITQRSVSGCQITLGSRLRCTMWSITGLPPYLLQVEPPSVDTARHWTNPGVQEA